MRKVVIAALGFSLALPVSAVAQAPSQAQEAAQEANDAKLLLGEAQITIARLRNYIEMLQQQKAQLQNKIDKLTPKKPEPAAPAAPTKP